jgi:hypothetical protein
LAYLWLCVIKITSQGCLVRLVAICISRDLHQLPMLAQEATEIPGLAGFRSKSMPRTVGGAVRSAHKNVECELVSS